MMAIFFIAGRMRLPLAVLEAFARARLTVLLALSHARIARQQAFGFQRGPQIGVHGQQRAGDAVADGARLPIGPATAHGDLRVKFVGRASHGQRLGGGYAQRFEWKIILEGTAIDQNFAGSTS